MSGFIRIEMTVAAEFVALLQIKLYYIPFALWRF
jgi:hypothetical protein